MDYNSHNDILKALERIQDADQDNRERAREAQEFVEVRDGQWEPGWWTSSDGKPRYTFDMTSPVVDQIAGEIEESDFSIDVRPAGGEATKQQAQVLDGLIRNIENISDANTTYTLAGRGMVTTGFDAWLVKADYYDDDSFDQDLLICPIANAVDSVWPGPFTKPDASDMEYCYVLEAMEKKAYDKKYPDRNGESVSDNRLSSAFFNKPEQVIIGQVYYIKKEQRELLLMQSGRVLENSEETQMILDELQAQGDTIVDRRNHPKSVVYTRLFDGHGWLNEAEKTVFKEIPVVLDLGNFNIVENKIIYRGVVEKLIDPQRVFNYSKSREIEEGALAPRAKYWMTPKQAAGHENTLATMNTNSDPVQFFNPDPALPGAPQQNGGAIVNPGLSTISADMKEVMRDTAGLHAANLGDNPNLQSGVAIKRLQDKGDVGSIKYFRAHERAIARTGRILVDAIPKVYDTRRQVRIMKEDGSFDMTMLNDHVYDQQSGQWVVINDLSRGKYDVTCTSGPSFDNRQQETVSAMTEMAQYDPSLMEMAGDVLFKNVNAPGMDLVADRKRQMLFNQGLIPFEQMTDEEKMQAQQQAQQPPPPDPAMLMAQAEQQKAQADSEANQVKLAIAQREQDRKDLETQLKAMKQQSDAQMAQMVAIMDQVTQAVNNLNTEAQTLKTLREAAGTETAVTPGVGEAYQNQTQRVIEGQ